MAAVFTCGIIEGFYGRPWTTEQRKHLFKQIEQMGMNSYMYAPKDDLKHRAQWRDLYTSEEAEHLQSLITAAKQTNVNFYYALSPGLDISYACQKEVSAIKRKLDQVKSLGCLWFALLFDDIEPAMCEMDKKNFASFAQAQVAVTNEVFGHLGCSHFMFCPTEYCESRAIPNLESSDYLNTIGQNLASEIQILWTGPRVVSRRITVEHLLEVQSVIRRKPVIWDNLFANDYDNKRLFLGPYAGRSVLIKSHVSGIMANPNCEFEANFVALHTLAQWNRSSCDAESDQKVNIDESSENEESESDCDSKSYSITNALESALDDWLPEIASPRHAFAVKPFAPPVAPTQLPLAIQKHLLSINNMRTEPDNFLAQTDLLTENQDLTASIASRASMEDNSMAQSDTDDSNTPAQRSTGSFSNTALTAAAISAVNSLTDDYCEPMELAPQLPRVSYDTMGLLEAPNGVEAMDSTSIEENNVDSCSPESADSPQIQENSLSPQDSSNIDDNMRSDREIPYHAHLSAESIECLNMLDRSDLKLMCGFFYLPFDHGSIVHHLFNDFLWLKANCAILQSNRCSGNVNENDEWLRRAQEFGVISRSVSELCVKLVNCPNRGFVYDMYPYIWELQGNLNSLNSLIKWMECGCTDKTNSFTLRNGLFDQGFFEMPSSMDEEPWQNRGGLTVEFQRLMSLETVPDLFISRPPHPPCGRIFKARPFDRSDRDFVYRLCKKSLNLDDSPDKSLLASVDQDLLTEIIGDRIAGPFLDFCQQHCFLCEEVDGSCDFSARPVGFGLAALNAKNFSQHYNNSYAPKIRLKYDAYLGSESAAEWSRNTLKQLVEIFSGDGTRHAGAQFSQCEKYDILDNDSHNTVLQNYPSLFVFRFDADVLDTAAPKRLLVPLLAALKLHGSQGIFSQVHMADVSGRDVCQKFGFSPVVTGSGGESDQSLYTSLNRDLIYYGRFI